MPTTTSRAASSRLIDPVLHLLLPILRPARSLAGFDHAVQAFKARPQPDAPRFSRPESAPILWALEQQLAGGITLLQRLQDAELDPAVVDAFHAGQAEARARPSVDSSPAPQLGRLDGRRTWSLSEYVNALRFAVADPHLPYQPEDRTRSGDLCDRPAPRRKQRAARFGMVVQHPNTSHRRASAYSRLLGYSGMPAVNAVHALLPADRQAKFRDDANLTIGTCVRTAAKLATLMRDKDRAVTDWQEFGVAAPDVLIALHILLAKWLCIAALKELPEDSGARRDLRAQAREGLEALRLLEDQLFSHLGWRLVAVEGLQDGRRRHEVFAWIQRNGGGTPAAMAHLFSQDSGRVA
jgi:hypothetical protein